MAASIRHVCARFLCNFASLNRHSHLTNVSNASNSFAAMSRNLAYFRSPIEYDYTGANKRVSNFRKKQAEIKPVKPVPEERDDIAALDKAEELLMSEQMEVFQKEAMSDMPLGTLPNPYAKPQNKCILCQHKVDLDYKNVRLLSQFVSPYTGQIYGRHITGLCIYMQKRVAKLIRRSRYFGFMPYTMKTPKYLTDPKLLDPFKKL